MEFDQTMNLTEEQRHWYYVTWAKWHEVMRPYDGFAASDLIRRLPLPPKEAFAECKLLPQREDILSEMPKGGRIGEVGTQQGIFAEKIAAICNPAELHLFDINMGPLKARHTPVLASAVLHEGDSSTLLAQMPVNYFDWIYIDADHTYPGVKKDIEAARPTIRPGGYLVFNDYTIWSSIEFMPYGVPYAVNELCIEHGWKFIYMALNPLMNFDVVLQKPVSSGC